MAKAAIGIRDTPGEQSFSALRQVAIVVCASAVIAVCARLVLPLPFTPVPLTLANLGVLLVGLTLGSKRGFAAAALYLGWGAVGLPVFSPAGPGGIAQLLGPTAGYLWAYPVVAFVAAYCRAVERRVSSVICLEASPRRWFYSSAESHGSLSLRIAGCMLRHSGCIPFSLLK